MGAMRDKMIRSLTMCGVSEQTRKTYLSAMKAYVSYYMKAPDTLGLEQIQKYHVYLINERKLAAESVNVHMNSIRFFYEKCMGVEFKQNDIPKTKRKKRVPIVLSQDEVARLLKAAANIKHKTLLSAMYASGLRAKEVTYLKPQDIHSERMLIFVKNGKGGKSRYSVLPKSLLTLLRRYWKENKNDKTHWLFPGQNPKKPLSYSALRSVYQKAREVAKLRTQASAHTLRHSFATHLLEMGTDLRVIQELMGHASIRATVIYTKVAKKTISTMKNPLDALNEKINLI